MTSLRSTMNHYTRLETEPKPLEARVLAALPIGVMTLRRDDGKTTAWINDLGARLLRIPTQKDRFEPLDMILEPGHVVRLGLTRMPLASWLAQKFDAVCDRTGLSEWTLHLEQPDQRRREVKLTVSVIGEQPAEVAVFLEALGAEYGGTDAATAAGNSEVRRGPSQVDPHLDTLLRRACVALRRGLDANLVAIMTADWESESLRLTFGDGDVRGIDEYSEPFNANTPVARSWREQACLSVEDLADVEGGGYTGIERGSALTSILHGASGPYGVILAFAGEPGAFSDEDMEFLEATAELISHALSRSRTERALEKSRREVKLARESQHSQRAARLASLGTLAAGVAHEIKNPINSMLMNVELARLLMQQGSDLDAVERCLSRVLDDCRRCADISDGIMQFARSDDDGHREPVPAEQLREGTMRVLGTAAAPTLQIQWRIADELPPLYVHRVAAEQVLANLVRNAVEADASRVDISVSASDSGIEIRVDDDGHGIAPVDLPRVYDPFFTTRGTPGNPGLGLTLASQIVSAHDGTLDVESNVSGDGKGTRVVLQFPTATQTARENPS